MMEGLVRTGAGAAHWTVVEVHKAESICSTEQTSDKPNIE